MSSPSNTFAGEGPKLLGVTWAIGGASIMCLAARCRYASRIRGHWRWDFIWAAAGSVVCFAQAVLFTIAVLKGLGSNGSVENPNLTSVYFYGLLSSALGLVAGALAKVAVVVVVVYLEDSICSRRRWILYAVAAFACVVNMVELVFIFTTCRPMAKNWDYAVPGSCPLVEQSEMLAKIQPYVMAVTDVIMAIWPIFIVCYVRQPIATKVRICFIMALGIVPGVLSLIRSQEAQDAAPGDTRVFGRILLYCFLETSLILVFSSLLVLQQLFEKMSSALRNMSLSSRRLYVTGGSASPVVPLAGEEDKRRETIQVFTVVTGKHALVQDEESVRGESDATYTSHREDF